MKKIVLIFSLLAFGIVTLFMSSSVLFDWFGIRAKQGNFVPFIVWANLLCGFLYLLSGYGIWKDRNWAKLTLWISLLILAVAFAGLTVRIASGGLYETKTIGAMAFRLVITSIFFFLTIKILKK